MPEFEQLLNEKSIILYFPPKGTAGLAIVLVNFPKREPWPPAKIIAIISFFIFSGKRMGDHPLPHTSFTRSISSILYRMKRNVKTYSERSCRLNKTKNKQGR
jgi:hypothetical protein